MKRGYQKSIRSLILISLLLCPAWSIDLHGEPGSVHPPVQHSYLSGSSAADIPFRLERGTIYLAAAINNGREVNLILDTGLPAGGVYLFDTDEANRIGQDSSRSVKLTLPGIVFPDVRLRRTSIRLECAAVGMIGPDLFGSCVVEVDFANSVINLHDPKTFKPAEGTAELPLKFFDRSPFVDVRISLVKGVQRSATCCLDLGSAGFLHLYSTDKQLIGPAGTFITGYLGTGVDGPIYGKWGRVESFGLADMSLKDVLCAFSSATSYPGHKDSIFGNIGNGILKKFLIAFDYQDHRVFLTPVKGWNGPTEFPWPSGMILGIRPGGGFMVEDVFGNTPAERLGIEKGHVINSVDGTPVDGSTAEVLLRTLSKQGKPLELKVLNDGRSRSAVLKMDGPI